MTATGDEAVKVENVKGYSGNPGASGASMKFETVKVAGEDVSLSEFPGATVSGGSSNESYSEGVVVTVIGSSEPEYVYIHGVTFESQVTSLSTGSMQIRINGSFPSFTPYQYVYAPAVGISADLKYPINRVYVNTASGGKRPVIIEPSYSGTTRFGLGRWFIAVNDLLPLY